MLHTNQHKKKYFVSFIVGYFPALHSWAAYQNYYLYPLLLARELGYTPVAIVKGGADLIKSDPNYDKAITVIYYKNWFQFFLLITKYSFLRSLFYINNHNPLSYGALILTKLMLCKNIFMGHIQPKRTTKIRQIIFNIVLFFTSKVRLNNSSEVEFLVSEGVSRRKLFVVPIGINSKVFTKQEYDYAKRDGVFYYGNSTSQKGFPTMFQAITLLKKDFPNIQFHIIGSQGDYDAKKGATEYGLAEHVIFHGPFEHGEKLTSLLNRFKVFVISTKAEGECMAVYEAALTGNALCLPRIMSFEKPLEGKALFHDLGDAAGLAKNISFYLKDDTMLAKDNEACISYTHTNLSEGVVKERFLSMLEA